MEAALPTKTKTKNKTVLVRMTQEDYARVQRRLQESGTKSISDYLRELVLADLSNTNAHFDAIVLGIIKALGRLSLEDMQPLAKKLLEAATEQYLSGT